MQSVKNWKIRTKLGALVTGILLSMMILGGFGLYQSSLINTRVGNMYTQEVVTLETLDDIKASLYRIRDRVGRHLAEPDRQLVHEKKIQEQLARLNKNVSKYKESRLGKTETKLMQDYKNNFNNYLDILNKQVLPLSRNGQVEASEDVLYGSAQTFFRKAREAINQLSYYQVNRATQRYENSNLAFKELSYLTIVILLLTILSAAIISWRLIYSITKPLYLVKKTLAAVDKGDLSQSVNYQSNDEIGDMAASLNDLIKGQRLIIEEIAGTMQAISDGNLSKRIQVETHGEFNKLKQVVNGSAEALENVMDKIVISFEELEQGNFSKEIEFPNKVGGVYKDVLLKMQATMSSLSLAVTEVNTVVSNMAESDFSHSISIELSGELDTLKQNINNTLVNLEEGFTSFDESLSGLLNGDLTARVQGDYKGQLAELQGTINSSLDYISTLFINIKQSSNSVLKDIKEIAVGNENLNERTQNQAASLEETAASLEEITSTINSSLSNAQEVYEQTRLAKQDVTEGEEVLMKTQDTMQAIHEASKKISEITTIINSIAFQTNLLALNAAVEAARAGEHGRGFAVVAGEVRTLAQRSSDAAKNIGELVVSTTNQIDHGTKMASDSTEMLKKISYRVSSVAEKIEEMNKASEEQSLGVSQINQAITSMDKDTQTNAVLVEMSYKDVQGINVEISKMVKLIDKFKLTGSHGSE